MARIVYNPPPGWRRERAGWVPPPGWQPPVGWPPMPQGWPLFVSRRRGLRLALGASLLAGLVLLTWSGFAAIERPLPVESLALVVVTLVALRVARFVPDRRPTPVTKWPWRPTPGMLGYRGEVDEALGEQVPWMRDGSDGR